MDAVRIKNAYKKYSKSTYVLKGLDMEVRKGSIYALLGPSGCGKTTLLSCIVGRMSLDSGTIETLAHKFTDVGYMPQNIALYMQLTIEQTFAYYGRVYEMEPEKILERSNTLQKLLELPPLNRIVESLSGGQQRRVSLAVSLIHNPDILILDEPTVGLDPILSESIWQYLLRLANTENKTIIITTHYIEEAKHSHRVGLMRNGVLLCEVSPTDLLKRNNCDTMEEAFLKLSHKQEATRTSEDIVCPPKTKQTQTNPCWKFSHSCFTAEIVKNWFFIWRNKPMLLFLFGLPLVITFCFNLAIGHEPQGIKIGVVNHDTPNGWRDCLIDPPPGCNFSYSWGCKYIRKMTEKGIETVGYDDVETATKAAKTNEVWGVVLIPGNFTKSLLLRLEHTLRTNSEDTERSIVSVWLDMSNQNIGLLLRLKMWKIYTEFMEDTFEECNWPKQTLDIPIKVYEPVYGEKVANLNHYASPAIMILLIFYLPMSYTIGVLVQEKMLGVLERSMIAGVNLIEVFISHTVIQVIILGVQMSAAMTVLYYIYESPFIGDPIGTAAMLFLQGISGIAFGFLVSMTFDKFMHATYASLGSVFSFFFLSGMVWPQQGAHFVLSWFRWLVPVSYSVEAMRALTVKGWAVTNLLVVKGYLSIVSWTVIYCLATHIILRLRKGSFGS